MRLSSFLNIIFLRFAIVGILNTAIHWAIFALCISLLDFKQSMSNLAGFMVAVTFSFFTNAKVTFASPVSISRYVRFTLFMGMLAYGIGFIAERFSAPPVFTLIIFSGVSLVLGYLFSRNFVFQEEQD